MNQDKAAHRKQLPTNERDEPTSMLDMSESPAAPDLDNFRRRAGEIIAKAAAARHKRNPNQE
jgi:hypothetical protein